MLDYLLRKTASMIISLMLIYVPKAEYEKKLESIPSITQRVASMNLQGWQFEKVVSAQTGQEHAYFLFPSTKAGVPTLVCLHGFNTDGSIFFKLKNMTDDFNVIAYNFPERSPLYTGEISDFTAILNDFFTTLGLTSVVLLGNSVGGAIALHYAAADASCAVSSLILTSTTIFGATDENIRQIRGMADKLLPYPDYKLYYMLTKGKAILGRAEKSGIAEDTPGESVAVKHVDWYRQILKSLYYYIGTTDAQNLHCPVYAFTGSADRLIPLATARQIEKTIPTARFNVIQGAGHAMVYSHADQIADLIKQQIIRE
jgi:pimeloyl-ACP methyl ester carboxylesterase